MAPACGQEEDTDEQARKRERMKIVRKKMRNRGRSERSNGRKGRVKSTHISTRIYSLLEKDKFFWTHKNLPLYEISIRQCAISASNTSGKHAAQFTKRETDARNIERAGGVRRDSGRCRSRMGAGKGKERRKGRRTKQRLKNARNNNPSRRSDHPRRRVLTNGIQN